MRGTPRGRVGGSRVRRFIPAYAGNTNAPATCRTRCPVHPRVCGEHQHSPIQLDLAPGSSPRMRGTLDYPQMLRTGRRFIPAYAGNTPAMSHHKLLNPVHPRVCGEHLLKCIKKDSIVGSSPRMRGTPDLDGSAFAVYRFIPAYAGNTPPEAQRRPVPAVHPRVCGEHEFKAAVAAAAAGSSPRMRGTRFR